MVIINIKNIILQTSQRHIKSHNPVINTQSNVSHGLVGGAAIWGAGDWLVGPICIPIRSAKGSALSLLPDFVLSGFNKFGDDVNSLEVLMS